MTAYQDPSFSVEPARYAKGQMAVHCFPYVGSLRGFKTRTMFLCTALRGRYSHRENAYIMSESKTRRLRKLYDCGAGADVGGEILVPEHLMVFHSPKTALRVCAELENDLDPSPWSFHCFLHYYSGLGVKGRGVPGQARAFVFCGDPDRVLEHCRRIRVKFELVATYEKGYFK